MEEDNLPFGKSGSLLINALCFLSLKETLRTDQNGKQRWEFLSSDEATSGEG